MIYISILILLIVVIQACVFCEFNDNLCCPDCPVVESIEPSEAVAGDKVTVKGRNFRHYGLGGSDEITVGGIPVNWTGEVTDTTIYFEVPSRAVSGKVIVCAGKESYGGTFKTLCSDQSCENKNVILEIF